MINKLVEKDTEITGASCEDGLPILSDCGGNNSLDVMVKKTKLPVDYVIQIIKDARHDHSNKHICLNLHD